MCLIGQFIKKRFIETEDLYIQKIGNTRIVSVYDWNKNDAIVEDLRTGLKYAISWDNFFKTHDKLKKYGE